MSLSNKQREESPSNVRRSRSSQKNKRNSSSREGSQITIKEIVERAVKYANSPILTSQPKYREQVLNLNRDHSAQSLSFTYYEINSSQKKQIYSWETHSIEEKKSIEGIKTKLLWCNGKQNNWVMIRVILAFHDNRISESQYYCIQLDSSNMDISLIDQRSLQQRINLLVQQWEFQENQSRVQILSWLKSALVSIHELFIEMKLNLKKRLVQKKDFSRQSINNNYILYPSPVSLTWSPQGMLCLTENKVGSQFYPIIGNDYSYRSIVETPYNFKTLFYKNNDIDDLKRIQERREEDENNEENFFCWSVKEEVNFSVFGKSVEENEIENKTEKFQKKATKDLQTCYIGLAHNISPKLEKIYKRRFCSPSSLNQLETQSKLKVFMFKNSISELEDGICYLVDKIQKNDRSKTIDALLQNEFSGYHLALNRQEGCSQFGKLKYQIICEFLIQQMREKEQLQHFMLMKCMLIQNEYFRIALENYFICNLSKLNISSQWKQQKLGTFDNFDDVKAEKMLFILLEQTLKIQKSFQDEALNSKLNYRQKPEKFNDPKYTLKKYATISDQNMQMNLFLKGFVKKNSESNQINELSPFSDLGINLENLNKIQNVNSNTYPFTVVKKVQFYFEPHSKSMYVQIEKKLLEAVIPVLWIKDRGIQNLDCRIAKKAIIANSKILVFYEKMNSLVNLWRNRDTIQKNKFMKNILKQYNALLKKSGKEVGKTYTAYCQRCSGDFLVYNIEEVLRVTLCSRCKFLKEMN